MASIQLKGIQKSYGSVPVVRGVDLEITDEEFMVFVGPSGCGKSTLLRMIAGLETISGGDLKIAGKTVNDKEPRNRDIAMVFQDYALYPHMSVRENLSFGLKMRKADPAVIESHVIEVAEMLQITPLLDRRPSELSGGQRQRVAMGRAIVRRPVAYLFDEPLSNLDAKLRVEMRLQIKSLHQLLRTTTIYVTHDQTEAMTLADRITVLRDGLIEQVGTPTQLYEHPASQFVAGFIGSPSMNFTEGTVVQKNGELFVRITDDLDIAAPGLAATEGQQVTVGIRPEHLEEPRHGDVAQSLAIHTTCELVETLGSDTFAICRVGEVRLMARLTPGRVSRPGDTVTLALDISKVYFFDPETGQSLSAHPATSS